MNGDIKGGFPFTSGAEADKELIAHLEHQIKELKVERDDWRKLALDLQNKMDAQDIPGFRS